MGKLLNIVLFFHLFAFLLLKSTISSFKKTKSTSNSIICVFHSPVILLFAHRVSASFAPLYISVLNDTATLIGCFKRTILQHQAASLFYFDNTVFHRNPLLASRCWIPVFFHSTSWCRVTCLICRPVVSEQQTFSCLFFSFSLLLRSVV